MLHSDAKRQVIVLGSLLGLASVAAEGCGSDAAKTPTIDVTLAAQGKDIFRIDTFGDETFWTDTLRMNEVIQAAVDPTTALAVGLEGRRRGASGRSGRRRPETVRSASPAPPRRSRC